ncbi:MAG: hypothetical protein ACYDBT_01680 [Desulfobulbaceae bacterium]
MKANMLGRGGIVFLAAGAILWCLFATSAYGGGAGADVCKVVTGESVARAVQGRIVESRPAEGRCVYLVALAEGGAANRAFVVYRHEPGDYAGLREVQEGEITVLDGLGDEAVLTFDAEAKRYWLLVGKRGPVTLQVSGDDPAQVRQVAAEALRQYAGQ